MSKDTALYDYGLELIRAFIGLVDFEIKKNKFNSYTMVDDEVSGHQQLTVQLVPPSDADEMDKEFPDFSGDIVGIMYALSALSFEGAKPRGMSEADYDKSSRWNISEFLARLKFEHGRLYAHFDYEHGRAMKTTLDADSKDWTINISTNDRGRSAEHWVRALSGKAKPRVVTDELEVPAH